MKHFRHNFTLLEILVAVAVLVIMMGFLFQFVISAQRVWAASAARTYMADQADAVFHLMDEDFQQIVVIPEDEDMDSIMGWHCDPPPKANLNSMDSLSQLCLFVTDQDDDDGAIYGVMYYYDSTGKKLYRQRTAAAVWSKVGETDAPADAAAFGLPAETISDEDYLVAENVTEFKVQAPGDADNTALPKFIRVTMTVQVPEELSNGTSKDGSTMNRTFSRVFFLDGGK
ncbi:MAG: hypothetical protein IKS83_02000 [Victivallales bacterium]|nr:hypothetical protein [Victivallales bacterium]